MSDQVKSKECTRCGVDKPLDCYHRNKSSRDGRGYACAECLAKKKRDYRNTNPEEFKKKRNKYLEKNKDKVKDNRLRNSFGISLEKFEELYSQQGECCAICGSETNSSGRSMCVDHCHDTGDVRGILCTNCNIGLGHFKDSPELLMRAAVYINYVENGTRLKVPKK